MRSITGLLSKKRKRRVSKVYRHHSPYHILMYAVNNMDKKIILLVRWDLLLRHFVSLRRMILPNSFTNIDITSSYKSPVLR